MRRRVLVVGVAAAAVTAAALAGGGQAAGSADGNEAVIELGRRLFHDPVIGRAGRVACAACHDPEHGFSDARVTSIDETGPLPRHSQPLTDLVGRGFHWDGEFDTVREIVEARVLPRGIVAARSLTRSVRRADEASMTDASWDRELLRQRAASGGFVAYYGDGTLRGAGVTGAGADESPVDARLQFSGLYAAAFQSAFGNAVPTPDRIVTAVDAYVASLRTGGSPFDRYLAGDAEALGPQAQRGHELFVGRAGCAQCHSGSDRFGREALTDGRFHDTGIAWNANMSKLDDRGRGAAALLPMEDGKFKTPSLRDVARRAPYMHDGRFETLADVVDYYDHGGTPHDALDLRIRRLDLTATEKADLLAFLEALSGDERAGLGAPAADRPARLRLLAVDPLGNPRAGLALTVRPSGDRLRGTERMPDPLTVTTDADGLATCDWPLSTHVAVTATDVDMAPLPLVPDCVASVTVTVLSRDLRMLLVPNGVCDGLDVMRASPKAPSSDPEMTLRAVQRLPNGRTVFVCDASLLGVRGAYLLRTTEGRTIGTYEISSWAAFPADLTPRLESRPEPVARLDKGIADRLTALTGIGQNRRR